MRTWAESKLNYTCQAFQEDIMGKNPISFGSLIRLANSGQNPTYNRILYFHTRYSNRNILSFKYQNQEIKKPKFIYAFRTTNLIKDSKSNKIILKAKIRTQFEGRDGSLDLIRKLTVSSILLRLRV